jgi:hypothetical protein
MPKIKCIKDVVMANGKQEGQSAFTEGQIYRSYRYLLKDGYDIRKVLCAKNNFGQRHTIKDQISDEFYNAHFEEVK